MGFYQQGGKNLNGPAYDWWYGCSPTSAGMMMGYYDINGYGGLNYGNLVPGEVAEATTFLIPNNWNYKVNNIIASQGYVNDYYRDANKAPDLNTSGNHAVNIANDDVAIPTHNANCLTDFMGSGQDLVGNANGWTQFWYLPTGAKTYAKDVIGLPDGMLGMDEYFRFAGYGAGLLTNDTSFYTQLIQGKGTDPNQGCTFADYQALIDAGLVAMIQVETHSMFGYGYDDNGNIILHDTWDGLEHTMAWGGTYSDNHLAQWGITVFTPSGGEVPLPSSLLLMISGLAGLAGFRLRK